MIHHLSFPDGSSVNDFIPKEISSVQYATIQDAIDLIKFSPKPVYMAKVDVESYLSRQQIDHCWVFGGGANILWMPFYLWDALVHVPF